MESFKPLLLLYGAKGLMLMRKSKMVLKLLIERHRGKLLAGLAVGMGASAYLQSKYSKPAVSESSKPVRTISPYIDSALRPLSFVWSEIRSVSAHLRLCPPFLTIFPFFAGLNRCVWRELASVMANRERERRPPSTKCSGCASSICLVL